MLVDEAELQAYLQSPSVRATHRSSRRRWFRSGHPPAEARHAGRHRDGQAHRDRRPRLQLIPADQLPRRPELAA